MRKLFIFSKGALHFNEVKHAYVCLCVSRHWRPINVCMHLADGNRIVYAHVRSWLSFSSAFHIADSKKSPREEHAKDQFGKCIKLECQDSAISMHASVTLMCVYTVVSSQVLKASLKIKMNGEAKFETRNKWGTSECSFFFSFLFFYYKRYNIQIRCYFNQIYSKCACEWWWG